MLLLAFGHDVSFRAPPVDAYTLPPRTTQTSERFSIWPSGRNIVAPTKVYGPSSITRPFASVRLLSVRPRAIWAMRLGLALAHRASDNPDASATVGASAPELGAATTELDSAVRAGALVVSGIAVDVVGTASDSAGSSSPPIMFPMIERTTKPPTIPPAIFQPLRFGAVLGVGSVSCCPGPPVWVADVHWFPSHHRRVLGAFSGSGYQPGGLIFIRRLYQEVSNPTSEGPESADVDARLDATRVLATGEAKRSGARAATSRCPGSAAGRRSTGRHFPEERRRSSPCTPPRSSAALVLQALPSPRHSAVTAR